MLMQHFQFVEGAGPVCAEQAGEAAVGEDAAAGLATSAVVRLIVGVADALHLLATAWTGLAVAAMDGHTFAEGGYLLRELPACLRAQAIDPETQRAARGLEQPVPFFCFEFLRLRDRRQPRVVQNLIGVGVSDPAQHARVGESALESMVLEDERGAEGGGIGAEYVDPSRIQCAQAFLAGSHVQRRTALRARFGEGERAL